MQRWGYLFLAMCLLLIGGCTSQSDLQDGIAVMFDRMPDIMDIDTVYYNGIKVGDIHSIAAGAGNVVKMMVSLDDEFTRYTGDNIALYPRRGRLEIEKLMAVGQPVQKGDLLSGFSTRVGLNWFKIKTLISDRILAAKHRAWNLHNLFCSP
jgi:hypothetical protein